MMGSFDLGNVVRRSRELLNGSKRYAFYLMLAIAGAVALLAGIELALFDADYVFFFPPLWWDLLVFAGTAPLFAIATANFGLHRAAGVELTFGKLFRHMDRYATVLLVAFPIFVLEMLVRGSDQLLLSLLFGILTYPVMFVAFFAIDREADALTALKGAYALVLSNVGSFLLVFFLSLGLVILGILTVGIGLIWVTPFVMILSGVIYAEAVGLSGSYA